MVERIGLRLRVVVVHAARLRGGTRKNIATAGPRSLAARGRWNARTGSLVAWLVFTITHVRPRTLLAVLSLTALTIGALPLASPAATAPKRPAAKKAAAAKPYRPHTGPAPADEYFGRLQMSILGVRNKVKDLGLDADIHPEHHAAVLGSALWVEDAMRDWAKRYPFDRWLPRYAYALEQMYERIPGDGAHKRAVKQVAYLTAYFPQTVYGKVGRAKLAMGIPTPDPSDRAIVIENELQRLALLDGKVQPTIPPAPTPTPSATPFAPPAPIVPAVDESPAPAATPAPIHQAGQ
jgi:hypothetical protein